VINKHVPLFMGMMMIDLTLAAEIGKQLLSANVQLEQNYRQLLQQQQHHSDSSYDNASIATDDESPDMRYLSSMNSRQVIIEVLEQKNNELNERLESLSTEHTTIKSTNSKRTKQLEAEMLALKSDLEMATSKIQELESMNQKQQQRRLNHSGSSKNQDAAGHDVDLLLSDLQRLEAEQQQAIEAKHAMETKLAAALKDLHQLKQQFDTFEFTEAGYKTLQQTYDRQFQHISQLNQSLEDHRAVFQKLRDRGIHLHSLSSTPCPSVIMDQGGTGSSDGGKHTLLDELKLEWNKRQQSDTANTSNTNKPTSSSSSSSASSSTLSSFMPFNQLFDMDPFETLLTKATGIDNGLIDDALRLISQLEQEIDDQPQNSIIPASVSAVGDNDPIYTTSWTVDSNFGDNSVDDQVTDDGRLHMALVEYSFPSQDLYPSLDSGGTLARYDPTLTPPGLIRQWVSKALQRLWRWFRFAFVLSTAIMISVWSGPDEMLLAIGDR
jgi:hypothetical protein